MTVFHPIWNPTWLIWMIILSISAGLAWLVAIPAGIHWLRKGHSASTSRRTFVSAAIIALVIGSIGTAVAFPFSGQYHRYVPVSGKVTMISSRLLADNQGGTTQKFVFVIGGQPYGCNDTRCALVKHGQVVTLMCERTWQWSGTPGWDCNWGKLGPNKA